MVLRFLSGLIITFGLLDKFAYSVYNYTMQTAIGKGDKISGGRLDKYYAIVEFICAEYMLICYNGECKSVRIEAKDFHRVI